MNKLTNLYRNHTGKISDRWLSYLNQYDQLFNSFREKPVRLLEIGVQNGGSLEIWSQYFPNAHHIVGCDIDQNCLNLHYSDPRIAVVVGDASTDETLLKIDEISKTWDIVIDDGSHRSPHIIDSFSRFFPRISDGGVFIAEDLHCSYWQEFDGGLANPFSSMAFFKQLADVINFEHWGLSFDRMNYLSAFQTRYSCCIDEKSLEQIHSVEFINSLCIIRKRPAEENVLGMRIVVGVDEQVTKDSLQYNKSILKALDQSGNFWPDSQLLTESKLTETESKLTETESKLTETESKLTETESKLIETESKLVEQSNVFNQQINHILQSKSWIITKPIRWFFTNIRWAKSFIPLIRASFKRSGGILATFRKIITVYHRDGLKGIRSRLGIMAHQIPSTDLIYPRYSVLKQQITLSAERIFVPKILIIGEMSIPQCKKYRVLQKQEMLLQRGYECTILDWVDTTAALEALQHHSMVIFYRVPGYESVMHVLSEAKRLNIKICWDVDDLIFDEHVLRNSKSLSTLQPQVLQDLINGASLYRSVMLNCDTGIASTPGLAKAMQEAGLKEVLIIENTLDKQTMTIVDKINNSTDSTTKSDKFVRIVYGSGSNTHNIDFEEAAPAINKILAKYPQVKFRVIGALELPQYLSQYKDQIEFFPMCTYEKYLVLLSECDISIAPLENHIFNDSKSNIKYIEASCLHLPSVCSPRLAFVQVITHGENGYLCANESEWIAAFSALVEGKNHRQAMGEKAYQNVMSHYKHVYKNQTEHFVEALFSEKQPKTVLSVNCYYAPRSFGGATIVAEELNKSLRDSGFNIHVVTALSDQDVAAYQCKRYEVHGINIFAIGIPDNLSEKEHFDNENIIPVFEDILKVTQPDIVHFHCIQGMGVSMLDVCKQFNIPYIVTLHDAWWLCSNQFMIDDGEMSTRAMIDAEKEMCSVRDNRVRNALNGAASILSPSKYFADVYGVNGFKEVLINKNGIRKPKSLSHERGGKVLRFGYVGGNTEIKGFHLIQKAFSKLTSQYISLSIVDNTTNLGYSSFIESDINFFDNILLIPGYTQNNMDEFFSNIDVLLFPSKVKESFGLTVREALIRNVWVITTDAGGVTEDIIEEQNGIVIPLHDDGEALLNAINKTIEIYSERYPKGVVKLPNNPITTFGDQAKELIQHFQRCRPREVADRGL